MSLTKRRLEEEEDYERIAYSILIDMQAIKECEIHSDFYYDTGKYDNNALYGIATNKLKEKYSNFNNFKLFSEKVNQIMTAAADSPSDCPHCDKLMKD